MVSTDYRYKYNRAKRDSHTPSLEEEILSINIQLQYQSESYTQSNNRKSPNTLQPKKETKIYKSYSISRRRSNYTYQRRSNLFQVKIYKILTIYCHNSNLLPWTLYKLIESHPYPKFISNSKATTISINTVDTNL